MELINHLNHDKSYLNLIGFCKASSNPDTETDKSFIIENHFTSIQVINKIVSRNEPQLLEIKTDHIEYKNDPKDDCFASGCLRW